MTGHVLRYMVVAVLSVTAFAPAQSATQPAPAPLTSVYDGQLIKRSRTASADPKSPALSVSPASNLDWQRLAIAMGIVIGLILLLRYGMLRLFPGGRVGKGTGAVRVIARTAIAPRQQVMLLQVGRRVVVVGDSGGALTSLAQIDDPDEVASLLGQIENAEVASPVSASRFKAMFNRQQQTFEEPQPEQEPDSVEPPPAEVANAQEEISGLIDRMRSLTKTIRQ